MRRCFHALGPIVVLLTAAVACPEVLLNETMPAPGSDWNGDGAFSPSEDEWAEIVNAGMSPADLTGLFLADAAGPQRPRFAFTGTLPPGETVFVTGEDAADWETGAGEPSVGLSLNNSGDTLYLFRAAGGTTTQVDSVSWTSAEIATDASIGRMPDGSGVWELFDALVEGGTGAQPTPGGPNGGPAAPRVLSLEIDPAHPSAGESVTVRAIAGDRDGIATAVLQEEVDGASPVDRAMTLVSGTPERGSWEVAVGPYDAGASLVFRVRVSDGVLLTLSGDAAATVSSGEVSMVLNEILADPPPESAGDANGDGVRDTADDEFVELYNAGSDPVDLSGGSVSDATAARHEFAQGTVVPPGGFLVVFGGGAPSGSIPGLVEVASTGGLSLNNTGDEVVLRGADGIVLDVHTYGGEANADQSLIRLPDGAGEWTRPLDEGLSAAFSPGAENGTATGLTATTWGGVKALYRR
ncbi:MAG: lamin tail domain-containing protein [Gemmatimonadota bacterium]|nr:lamin tail domain-containing protein [Gemmatimonadota bacterium]MDP6803355.1 lamin tail domain-containing protein [Gemmatimonadota bacterium]MDP7032632.1 lamin tail domain-containing protein [Gemmatimonadota bacterium]